MSFVVARKEGKLFSDAITHDIELLLGAVGQVLGDIFTSVFYVMTAIILAFGLFKIKVSITDVIGFTSLVIYTLAFIHVKYIIIALQALNEKAGGIQPLAGLIMPYLTRQWQKSCVRWSSGFSTCLLIADAALTPAITLLSATAGLATKEGFGESFNPYILPLAICLAFLVAVGQYYPKKLAKISGPINIAYGIMLFVTGIRGIFMSPEILQALNPFMSIKFIIFHTWAMLIPVLGGVFMSATGGEALYADAEHFGPKAIKRAWYFAGTCLIVHYLGQGGYIIDTIKQDQPLYFTSTLTAINPIFGLFPSGWMYWVCFAIGLGAAFNASLALFPATHSNLRVANIQGLAPRIEMVEKNANHKGQLCSNLIVGFMTTLVIILMSTFKTATALEAAYGISIIIAMNNTDMFLFIWAILVKKWYKVLAILCFGLFMLIDGSFLWANIEKIPHGGWVTLVIAFTLFVPMVLWSYFRSKTLEAINNRGQKTFEQLKEKIKGLTLLVSNGVEVHMHRAQGIIPLSFLRKLEIQNEIEVNGKVVGNLVVRKINIFLCVVESSEKAHIKHTERIVSFNKFKYQGAVFVQVVVAFGFYRAIQIIDEIVWAINKHDPAISFEADSSDTRFFYSREHIYDNRNLITKFFVSIFNMMGKLQPYPQFGINPTQLEFREFDLDLSPKSFQKKQRMERRRIARQAKDMVVEDLPIH